MDFIKIAKKNLRSELKKKLLQMTTNEITEQSKIITNKVKYFLLIIYCKFIITLPM